MRCKPLGSHPAKDPPLPGIRDLPPPALQKRLSPRRFYARKNSSNPKDGDLDRGEFSRRGSSLGSPEIRTLVRAPKTNAIAERLVGTLRRECLDHVFVFNERHLQRLLDEFVGYYNRHRPHRSLDQRPPCPVVPTYEPAAEVRNGSPPSPRVNKAARERGSARLPLPLRERE